MALEKPSPEGTAEMKSARLLNWIIYLAFAAGAVAWSVGFYRQHIGQHSAGPIGVLFVCWGVVAYALCTRAILNNEIRSRRVVLTRQQNPGGFWIFTGVWLIAGSCGIVFGIIQLVTHR
jgi:hypothetical protein